jgi:hypothetical protein
MDPYFFCTQLIGANFDTPSETLVGFPKTEAGVAIFFSSVALYPGIAQVKQWCALANRAPGSPVDCFIWSGDPEKDRRPIGAVRIVYVVDKEQANRQYGRLLG